MSKPNLKKKYDKEVVLAFQKKFGVKNIHEVPRIERITLNVGAGSEAQRLNHDKIQKELAKIAGQSTVKTQARKAIAGFKTREGLPIGIKVTLRGKRMWEFLERFIVSALPRIKDFQGIPLKSFSQKGDCSVGIKEHIVFPEINPDEADFIFGLQVVINLDANSQEEGIFILKELGFPVAK